MMQPIFQLLVDYWWLVPLAGTGLVVYRFAGWRGLLAVAALGLAGGLWTEGRRHERARAAEAAERRRQKALEDRSRVDAEISKLDPDQRRKRLSPWMRDD
jgi:hypothetical protein